MIEITGFGIFGDIHSPSAGGWVMYYSRKMVLWDSDDGDAIYISNLSKKVLP